MKPNTKKAVADGQRWLKFLQVNWPAFYIPLMVLAISREIVPALLVAAVVTVVFIAKAGEERKK